MMIRPSGKACLWQLLVSLAVFIPSFLLFTVIERPSTGTDVLREGAASMIWSFLFAYIVLIIPVSLGAIVHGAAAILIAKLFKIWTRRRLVLFILSPLVGCTGAILNGPGISVFGAFLFSTVGATLAYGTFSYIKPSAYFVEEIGNVVDPEI